MNPSESLDGAFKKMEAMLGPPKETSAPEELVGFNEAFVPLPFVVLSEGQRQAHDLAVRVRQEELFQARQTVWRTDQERLQKETEQESKELSQVIHDHYHPPFPWRFVVLAGTVGFLILLFSRL